MVQPMNYVNYEGKIVEQFGVALDGWPTECTVSNPNKLRGWQEVMELLTKLQNQTCKWVCLTDEELKQCKLDNMQCQKAGEQIYVPRRRLGVQAQVGGKSTYASKDIISEDEDEDQASSDDENEDSSDVVGSHEDISHTV